MHLIKQLVEYEICDVNSKFSTSDLEDLTPLHVACDMGHLRVVRYLLSKNADPNATLNTGQTPLLSAIYNEHIDVVKELLKHNANPNLATNDGVTPLHYAVAHNMEDMVELLLSLNNINVNALSFVDESHSNVTPLYTAAELGYNHILKLLIQRGSDMDIATSYGHTPLIVALSQRNESTAMILIESGCDISKRTDNGATALHFAIISKCANSVKALLERGADPNVLCTSVDVDNISPLHLACEDGNLQFVKLLIQFGAHVNTEQTENGYPPFISAVNGGNVQVIRLLLEHGADPTFHLKDGSTAIHAAISAEKNPAESLEEVLKCEELDVNEKIVDENNNAYTALHLASEVGDPRMIRALLARGAEINAPASKMSTPLIIACEHNKVEAAIELIKHGADVTLCSEDGTTALHIASAYSLELVKLLIEKGADVNATTTTGDLQGATPLHIACEFGQTEIVKLLLENKANVNCRLYNGQPPLINACKSGVYEIVEALLKHGADAKLTSAGNTSALHVAVMTGSLEIVKLLLETSDINLQNEEGNTALHIAYGVQNHEIISELIKHNADTELKNKKGEKPIDYKM